MSTCWQFRALQMRVHLLCPSVCILTAILVKHCGFLFHRSNRNSRRWDVLSKLEHKSLFSNLVSSWQCAVVLRTHKNQQLYKWLGLLTATSSPVSSNRKWDKAPYFLVGTAVTRSFYRRQPRQSKARLLHCKADPAEGESPDQSIL